METAMIQLPELDNLRLCVRRDGPEGKTAENAETVLFVHGFPLNGSMWDASAAALADTFHVVVPDLRAFGGSGGAGELSSKPSGAPAKLTMRQHADDLAALLDALGVEGPVHFIGLSMGGYIAFEFIRNHRDRMRSLVLVDTRAEGDTEEVAAQRRATADDVLENGSQVVANAMVEKLFASATDETVKQTWLEVMQSVPPATVAAALRGLAERVDAQEMLSAIDVPTLVLVGEEDAITPVDVACNMADAIPGAKMEIIFGAGHMTPVEQPDEFTDQVRRFLDTVE